MRQCRLPRARRPVAGGRRTAFVVPVHRVRARGEACRGWRASTQTLAVTLGVQSGRAGSLASREPESHAARVRIHKHPAIQADAALKARARAIGAPWPVRRSMADGANPGSRAAMKAGIITFGPLFEHGCRLPNPRAFWRRHAPRATRECRRRPGPGDARHGLPAPAGGAAGASGTPGRRLSITPGCRPAARRSGQRLRPA